MNPHLFNRIRDLLVLNREPKKWNCQTRYDKSFYAQGRKLTDDDIRGHLKGDHWIGTRLSKNALQDRVIVDIDCDPGEIDDRNRRYRMVRRVFGDSTALVWQTPSGHGIRVAYSIPPVDEEIVNGGRKNGLVEQVLRYAGLDIRGGVIEIYPCSNHYDRQPFGKDMPFLDPESLEPLWELNPQGLHTEQDLIAAVEHVERWRNSPDENLLNHLQKLPGARANELEDDFVDAALVINRNHGVRPGAGISRLITEGLYEPSSRYRVEFAVGKAVWLWPELFRNDGLEGWPDRESAAWALATWLSRAHNGYSQEWLESTRTRGDTTRVWAERYLKRNETGLGPIDRMGRAAAAMDPGMWPTVNLTRDERRHIASLARRANWAGHLPKGIGLYRFEVWASGLVRFAKSLMRSKPKNPDGSHPRDLEIAAQWMEDLPYGRQYALYRRILVEEGFLEVIREYEMPPSPDIPGRATTFRFPEPKWMRLNQLPLDLETIKERVASAPLVHGRPLTMDEALHMLALAEADVDVRHRYGKATHQRLQAYYEILYPPSSLAGF